MRLMIFFDLPRYTEKQNRQANRFRKDLLEEGFIMLQESVYCKLALNNIVLEAIKQKVRKMKPDEGNVMMLCLTEKQFENIELLFDKTPNGIVENTDRLVVL